MDDIPIPLPDHPVRFLDKFRAFIRLDGKSYSTEQTYVHWVELFIRFSKKKRPSELNSNDVNAFLTHIAVSMNAAANTQKTALNALMFLFNRYLKRPIENLEFRYARKPRRTPTVLSHDEAMRIIDLIEEPYKLMVQLMYGSGLRVSEAIRLRVKDVDFAMGYIVVRDGKGSKDRTTLLPKKLQEPLKQQIEIVDKLLALDTARGIDGVYMPNRLAQKYPNAGKTLTWQYVFPSSEISIDPRTGLKRRHHVFTTSIQSRVKQAVKKARVFKQVSCHTFRHSFATRLLQAKNDLKQIQTLMGHTDIRTTEIYLHVLDELGDRVKSPLDD